MSPQKMRFPLGSAVGAAALAVFAVAAAVAIKRHVGRPSFASGGHDALSNDLEGGQLSDARLRRLDPEEFHKLCYAYYRSRQFHLRDAHVSGDMRDAALYFGTLPHPVGLVRVIGAGADPIDLDAIRDLAEAMAFHGVAKGIVHAPGGYTDAAMGFARVNRIRLVSGDDFARNISEMPEGARAAMLSLLARDAPEQPRRLDAALH